MILLSVLMACSKPAPPPALDLVVIGEVHATPPDAGRRAAVLVAGGKVVEVVEEAEGRARAGDATVLEAMHVTPGFVDAHAHPVGLGKVLGELDLVGAASYAETLERVAGAGGAGWLTGRGWDQNDWPDTPAGGWPLASDLDAIVGERPAYLRRVDGHAGWVNSEALRRSGIDATTPDPPGGRIVRDAEGNPSGVLIDNAIDLLDLETYDDAAREAWVLRGTAAMAEAGLTGADVMGTGDATLAVIERLDAEGRLPVRLWVYVDPETDAAQRLITEGPWRGDRVEVVGVKQYVDGALGSRGALLSAEYADDRGNTGNAIATTEEIAELATALVPAGAQLACHAIGDAAVTRVLDGFAAARAAHPDATVRLRVEHSQVVHPDDVPRFAELNAIASFQPTHATSDMPWAQDRLGPERVKWAYAWRTLSDAGAHLALGSDFPVESVDPGLGLWAATRRTDLAGTPEGGWFPEQVLTEDEAIAGFTSWAAYAAGVEDRFGVIAPGREADLTLWTVEDGRWKATNTIVAGRQASD